MTGGGGCGTYAGYQAHGKRRETPCTDCIEAAKEYNRRYRRTSTGAALTRLYTKARSRACADLIKAHRYEYTCYYQQRLAELRAPDSVP